MIRQYSLTLSILLVFCGEIKSQTPASLSITTYTAGPCIARDQINLTLYGSADGGNGGSHLYLDRSAQLPVSYLSFPPSISGGIRAQDKSVPPVVIKGEHSVDLSGAFNYAIPIQMPPGTNNMLPSLSMVYNSNAEDTYMGRGWGVSGLSMISRTSRNLFNDQNKSGIEFGLTGPFILDGNRLVFQSTNGNGENIFFTENETFSMITLKNPNNPGQQYFEVKTKSGLTMIYGNTSDSRAILPYVGRTLPANGAVTGWYLNKVIDNYGNYMEYSYYNSGSSTEGSDVVIKEINYTGNVGASISPYNSIKFYYDLKTIANKVYLNGDYINRKLVLREISVFSELSSIVPCFNYKLGYSSNEFLDLNEIKFSTNGQTLNSTLFIYGSAPPARTKVRSSNLPLNADYSSADLNGDGLSDLVAFLYNAVDINTGAKSYVEFRVYINAGQQGNSQLFTLTQTVSEYFSFSNFVNTMLGISPVKNGLLLADVVGDEIPEVIYSHISGSLNNEIYVRQYNKTTQQFDLITFGQSPILVRNPTQSMAFGDFDGDGKAEMISYFLSGSNYEFKYVDFNDNTSITKTDSDSPQTTIVDSQNQAHSIYSFNGFSAIDFDGDGKSDLIGNPVGGGIISVIRVGINSSNLTLSEIYRTSMSLSHSLGGDYNGDGYTDFVMEFMNHLDVTYGTGLIWTTSNQFASYNRDVAIKRIPMDINNDGRTDVVELYSDTTINQVNINVANGAKLSNSFYTIGIISNCKSTLNKDDELDSSGDRNLNYSAGDGGDYYATDDNTVPVYETGDFNGDGNMDLLLKLRSASGGASDIRFVYFNEFSNEKYISEIFDGNNNWLRINYFRLSNPSILSASGYPSGCNGAGYTKAVSGPSYPLSNATPAMNVVSYVSDVTNGTTDGSREAYAYYNAVSHLQGRGFLGFDKVIKMSRKHGAAQEIFQSTKEFDIIPVQFVRRPTQAKEEFISPGGNKVFSTTTYNSGIHIYSTIPNLRYFSELSSVTTTDNFKNVTTTLNYSYDYTTGNITSETTNIGPNLEVTTRVLSNFTNAGSWLSNNAPRNESVTVARSGESPFTRNKQFTYISTGLISSTSEEPNTSGEVLTTNIYDPNTGVLKQVTKAAPQDQTVLSTTTNYDYDLKSRFIEKTSIASIGYSAESRYEPVYGNRITSKDESGSITQYSYNPAGMLSEIENPDHTKVKYIYDWYNTSYADPIDPKPVGNEAQSVLKIDYPDGKTSIMVSDRFGRTLKTWSNTFNNLGFSNLSTYNDNGDLVKQYGPYLSPLPNGKVILETTNTYAPDLGVLTNKVVSDGSNNLASGVSYNFNTLNKEVEVTTTRPDGKSKTQTTDATGRLIKVQENGNTLTYEYHFNGGDFINITKLNGNMVLTKKADLFGHPTEESEPNTGTKTYVYNAFGQMSSMKDFRNTMYTFEYDVLGQLIKKTIGPDIYNYHYNNAGLGKGKLGEMNLNNGNAYKYLYDDLGRLKKQEEYLDGKSYFTSYEYDQLGRIAVETYPNNFSIRNEYVNGDLAKIRNCNNNSVLWQLDELDNCGAIAKFTLGNNIQTQNFYNNFGIKIGSQSGSVLYLGYNYNLSNGNLNYVTDYLNTNNSENYTYDSFDRLTGILSNNLGGPVAQAYDNSGNITNKYDAGTYTYHSTKVNQAIEATNVCSIPIDNSPQISTQAQDVTFNAFDKASYVLEGNNSIDIFYDPSMERYKSVFKTNSNTTNTRYYLNRLERNVDASSNTTDVNYVYAPSGLCAIRVQSVNSAAVFNYVYTDYRNSIVATTDNNGFITARQSFDAWGRRRDPSTGSYTSISSVPDWLTRGYTGHEHLPQFTLINMNGRMYDPILARMLSADPVLPDPTNSQDYNKYSYVRNNPLKYTDPSGYYGETYFALALFAVGEVVGNALDYGLNRDSQLRSGSFGQALVNGATHSYYAFNQCTNMFTIPIFSGKNGNSTYGVNANITFGSQGMGIGATAYYNYQFQFENGSYLTLGAAAGTDFNRSGPNLINNQRTLGAGFVYGNEDFHAGLYSTQFFSGASSQRVGGLMLGGKDWSITYENDGAFPFKHLGLGDGGDEFRTAAFRAQYKEYSFGFNLMTEARNKKIDGNSKEVSYLTDDGWKKGGDINELHNTQTYVTNPTKAARLGGLYFGHGNNYFGFNSDKVRDVIQNQAIHKRSSVDSPLFSNYNYGTSFYGGVWNKRPYSLW